MAIECQGVNYDLMSQIEKVSVEEGFQQFLNTLRHPIQIYIQTRTVNLENSISTYKEVKDNGKRVLLSHYPMPFYRGDYNADIVHLYGHVHMTVENDFMERLREHIKENDTRNRGKHQCQFYNVGCMMPWMNFYPRTLEEIISANQ